MFRHFSISKLPAHRKSRIYATRSGTSPLWLARLVINFSVKASGLNNNECPATAKRIAGATRCQALMTAYFPDCMAARLDRTLILSGAGKSAGALTVTFPVAAHSVPRCRVAMNPTQLMAATSCPMIV